MSANPSNEDIMEAIGQSGYLMEQHVATQLEALGFQIRTNVAFEDPDERKSREIDVLAFQLIAVNESAKVSAVVELIVECKNSSNPLVFITRPKNSRDALAAPMQFRYPTKYEMRKDLGGGRSTFREFDGFFHLGFDKLHYGHLQRAKAVQFCRIDRKGGGWHANHGGLYDATFYPMAKAIASRLANAPKNANPRDWRYLWILFPIIVTSGDLLVIDSTKLDPVPEPKDWVGFSRDLQSGNLTGTYALDFVRQDQLEKFVHECIDPLGRLAKELVETKHDFLLRTDIPWQD